jgi:proton translocating ATP synthase F1 alpha subunit
MVTLFKKDFVIANKLVCLHSKQSFKRFFSTDTNESADLEVLQVLESSVGEEFSEVDEEYDLDFTGFVVTLGDGIAKIEGLRKVGLGELLSFESGETGMVLGIEDEYVSAVIFGNYENIKQDHAVFGLGLDVGIEAGVHLLGKVVNALGESLDPSDPVLVPDDEDEDDEESLLVQWRKADVKAPGIIPRLSVREPVYTGLIVIDSMVPIGRGQRELIIGDRKTGKTSIVLDTIINQNLLTDDFDALIKCVYVSIGQKASSVALLSRKLQEFNSSFYTTIVAATASDSASLQFLAPYVGCAIAEYYRDSGEHAIVVYDDLSKQAVAYRQMSLLLRRPPGREAYPGDVFYIHSRLLERAAKLNEEYGLGSLTALPIIEIQAGDVSAYIPTNVISITDGQIVLDNALFYKGVRPAVNVGLSVSRVGSSAQIPAMKQIAGSLKLELAQYREVLVFEKVGGDLDEITKLKLKRGRVLVDILKQKQFSPLSVDSQIILIYAGTKGYIDNLSTVQVEMFKEELSSFVDALKDENGREVEFFDRSAKLDEVDELFIVNLIKFFLSRIS